MYGALSTLKMAGLGAGELLSGLPILSLALGLQLGTILESRLAELTYLRIEISGSLPMRRIEESNIADSKAPDGHLRRPRA